MTSLDLPGAVSAAQLRETAAFLAGLQAPDGVIPWFEGHHADPWDHVESAMALTVCGYIDEARRAFDWSARHQGTDGSWPMETTGATVTEASIDTNQVAYIAVGVWHHWLITRDLAFVDRLWPTVRTAIELVVDLQLPGGAIRWSRDAAGVVTDGALLTGSASIVTSLRAAMALAELVDDPQPDWELAAARLAHAVARHQDTFIDKNNFAMDWYYPVLGGAVRGRAGLDLLESRWGEFVVPDRGCLCVSDRPWVTAAETAELALALHAVGARERAVQLVRDLQFLRADGGGYWTGWVYPEDTLWPAEQTSWTAAAIILAADSLSAYSPGHALFRGDRLPALLTVDDCDRSCLALTGSQTHAGGQT
jgi:hypothetical protein